MNAVDTNVLIYVHDPRDPRKQQIAKKLIENLDDGVLLWQVACEYIAASRKLEPLGYSLTAAWKDLHDLRRMWIPTLPTWAIHDHAERIISASSISYWDALIVAACTEAGVAQLYTEDLGGCASIEGITIINPFAQPA
jgi:predicted nucleic acid-binding protein